MPACKATRIGADQHGAGISTRLEPRGQIRGFTNDRLLLCRSGTEKVSNDHQTCRNAHTGLQRDTIRILYFAHLLNNGKSCSHRLLGIIFARLGIAEISEHPIAHVPGYHAVEPAKHFGDAGMIG